jgi:hypothetical protein
MSLLSWKLERSKRKEVSREMELYHVKFTHRPMFFNKVGREAYFLADPEIDIRNWLSRNAHDLGTVHIKDLALIDARQKESSSED